MHLNADISSALQLLEDIKLTINELDDAKLQGNANREINVLVSVLENPIFRSIVTIQDSLYELNQQLGRHPSILPVDFDITLTGELALNVPPAELFDPGYAEDYHHPDFDEQRVPSAPVSPGSPQLHGFNEDNVLLRSGKSLGSDYLPQKSSHGPNEEENIYRSPSAISDTSKTGSDAILNSEWAQVEAIDLINDGTGLGFGIVGVRAMGVVVKTILPGGVADRDGRLQSGDHILQIGDVNLHEMGSEQVATVLRQSGTHVRLIVARPAEFSMSPDYKYLSSSAPLVPTRLLNDPNELDQYLVQHKYPPIFKNNVVESTLFNNSNISSNSTAAVVPTTEVSSSLNMDEKVPEMEKFTVALKKDHNGLGITIAGYVCEKEELSGIFIKSISKGSAADLSKKIQVNDRIVEVDGRSLQGYTNLQAVEVLRSCGSEVRLCLERYLHGPKFEQLQQAIAASTFCNANQNQRVPGKKDLSLTILKQETVKPVETRNEFINLSQNSQEPLELTQAETDILKKKWIEVTGSNFEIVIAELTKFGERGGLGISLEGTVDVEDGQEVRPHHYIRSILPEGPVGKNGKLRSGDELLEVNGHRLLGMNHHEVVSILKELPIHVRMVCGRPSNGDKNFKVLQDSPFCQRGTTLGGSLQNLFPATDRLVKAKSDGSLTTSIGVSANPEGTLSKMKSRSLEPLTGLAMWSSEPQVIELVKGERGLGFSILDYQDPIDPNDTVIVIRSLVPGGVAQIDGRLIPGDRLLFVNDTILENASLDQAVQALKGAPKGIVRIGVAKPLPILDSLPHTA